MASKCWGRLHLYFLFFIVKQKGSKISIDLNYGYPSLFTEQQVKAFHRPISCAFLSIKTRANAILRFYLNCLDNEVKDSKSFFFFFGSKLLFWFRKFSTFSVLKNVMIFEVILFYVLSVVKCSRIF